MAVQGQITRIKLQKGRYLVKRREIWYLETCVHNLQERHSLDTSDLQEATRRAAQLEEPLRSPLPQPAPAESLTLPLALEEYEAWYHKNRREHEANAVIAVLRNFIGHVDEELETRAVSRDQVQRWVDSRVDGRAPSTVNRDFARLRAFPYWLAKRKDVVDLKSCRGVDRPKDDGTTKEAPSPERVKSVIGRLTSHPWLPDYCTLLAETGMRPTELLGLGVGLPSHGTNIFLCWDAKSVSVRRKMVNGAGSGGRCCS